LLKVLFGVKSPGIKKGNENEREGNSNDRKREPGVFP